jgi:hypothetical protein
MLSFLRVSGPRISRMRTEFGEVTFRKTNPKRHYNLQGRKSTGHAMFYDWFIFYYALFASLICVLFDIYLLEKWKLFI